MNYKPKSSPPQLPFCNRSQLWLCFYEHQIQFQSSCPAKIATLAWLVWPSSNICKLTRLRWEVYSHFASSIPFSGRLCYSQALRSTHRAEKLFLGLFLSLSLFRSISRDSSSISDLDACHSFRTSPVLNLNNCPLFFPCSCNILQRTRSSNSRVTAIIHIFIGLMPSFSPLQHLPSTDKWVIWSKANFFGPRISSWCQIACACSARCQIHWCSRVK